MNSYDQWIDVMVAVKAATGGSEEGFALFDEWSAQAPRYDAEVTRQKWDSFRPPYRKGWGWLAARAAELSGGDFSSADEDFAPVDDSTRAENALVQLHDSTRNMFERYAWIEAAKRVVNIDSGALLDQEQFEFRVPPNEKGISPWKVFKENPRQRKSYAGLTFRPGAGRLVEEHLADLQGLCFNTWREPDRAGAHLLPDAVTDREVDPYLELAAHVIPIDAEREHFLDYLAYIIQRPGEKINHAMVLGSRVEGIGKDTLLEPLRCAIGRRYVKEVAPDDLIASWSDWLVDCKVGVVQEMHNFERKAVMNRLKPLVAAPPDALPVNQKFRNKFFIPNIIALIFFTNEDDALALSKGDRRYHVTWNDGEPKPESYYAAIWAWLSDGGTEAAVRWLMQRDVSKFNAKGRAPMTAAKADMRKAARSPVQEWIEEGLEDAAGVWSRDLVVIDELAAIMPEYVKFKGQALSTTKIGKALRAAGAEIVTDKLRIDGCEGSRRIWALRRVATYRDLGPEEVRDLFIGQRSEANARGVQDAESAFRNK